MTGKFDGQMPLEDVKHLSQHRNVKLVWLECQTKHHSELETFRAINMQGIPGTSEIVSPFQV
jgi:hypothetical protein